MNVLSLERVVSHHEDGRDECASKSPKGFGKRVKVLHVGDHHGSQGKQEAGKEA